MKKIFCKCGCGKKINEYDNHYRKHFYIIGHNLRGTHYGLGRKLSKEHRASIGNGNRGKIFTTTRRKNISEALKGNKNCLGHKKTAEERRQMSERQRGDKAYHWKGGKMGNHGYLLLYAPDHPFASQRHVLEHHLVMEKHIGRYLRPGEVVHHENGNKTDNRIENLKLFPNNSEHLKYHYETKKRRKQNGRHQRNKI